MNVDDKTQAAISGILFNAFYYEVANTEEDKIILTRLSLKNDRKR